MTISTLAQYKSALSAQRDVNGINIASSAVVAGRSYDLWRAAVPIGNVPTAPVACDRSTVGALGQENPSGLTKSIIGVRANANSAGTYLLVDRLSHQGGLSAIVIGASTTNLPTAAIPRYVSGDGVMIGLTIYTQIGTTATTVSASYTNQDGVAGQITPLVAFGGTGFREANRMILLPLASGDTGARSVQSVSVTATTGTAGAFGVTLFKPLAVVCITDSSGVLSAGGFFSGGVLGGIPQVLDDACIAPICIMGGVNAQMSGAVLFAEH